MSFDYDDFETAVDDVNKKCEKTYDDCNSAEAEADSLVELAKATAQACKDARESADEAKDECENLYTQLADLEEELAERDGAINELREQLKSATSGAFFERLQKLHKITGALLVEYESMIGDADAVS